MSNYENEEIFSGEWMRIGDAKYSCWILPKSMPDWFVKWAGGDALGLVLAVALMALHNGPPFKVLVFKDTRWSLKDEVVYCEDITELKDANLRAIEINRRLEAGILPP